MGFSVRPSSRGLSLAEVVVVATIVLLLATVVVTTLGEGRRDSHDKQRVSDLTQIQAAFRVWRDNYSTSTYPSYPNGDLLGDGIGVDTTYASYVSGTIKDPLDRGTNRYYYDSNYTCNGTGRTVLIALAMEQPSSANYTATCGAATQNLGIGVTPNANSYIIILK